MKEPPAVDAAPIGKDSSEVKEGSLSEDPKTGSPKDGDFEVVEEEEKKAGEQPISEVPYQDKEVESLEDFSQPLQTPRNTGA